MCNSSCLSLCCREQGALALQTVHPGSLRNSTDVQCKCMKQMWVVLSHWDLGVVVTTGTPILSWLSSPAGAHCRGWPYQNFAFLILSVAWRGQCACVAQVGISCGASENGFPALGKKTSEATLPFSPLFLPEVFVSGYGAWDCGSLVGPWGETSLTLWGCRTKIWEASQTSMTPQSQWTNPGASLPLCFWWN